jgi:hypothetical protein
MRIHGVTAQFVKELRDLVLNVAVDDLVKMRIHRVTPQFIRDVRAAGFRTCRPTISWTSASTVGAGWRSVSESEERREWRERSSKRKKRR